MVSWYCLWFFMSLHIYDFNSEAMKVVVFTWIIVSKSTFYYLKFNFWMHQKFLLNLSWIFFTHFVIFSLCKIIHWSSFITFNACHPWTCAWYFEHLTVCYKSIDFNLPCCTCTVAADEATWNKNVFDFPVKM